jgi:hypothetical protein
MRVAVGPDVDERLAALRAVEGEAGIGHAVLVTDEASTGPEPRFTVIICGGAKRCTGSSRRHS